MSAAIAASRDADADPALAVANAATRWLRRIAMACMLLMLIVVGASAWLRLAATRPVCGDWPACRGVPLVWLADQVAQAPAPPRAGIDIVRAVHRVAASTVLVLVIAACLLARRLRPHGALVRRSVLAMLAVVLALSVLGIATPGSRSMAVMQGNLLGGFVLFALAFSAWRVIGLDASTAPARPAPSRGWRRAALVCAVLWLVQAALGARSGVGGSAVVPAMHLALAILAASGALLVGQAVSRQDRRPEGPALMGVVLLQALGGLAIVHADAPPLGVVLHNLIAAVGLALLLGVALVSGAGDRH